MKFVPVSRAMVSITTASSTSLKSSCTRSSAFAAAPGEGGSAGAVPARGGGGAVTGCGAVWAPARATMSPAARLARTASTRRSNTLFLRGDTRRRTLFRKLIGESTLAPVRALHGDVEAFCFGELPEKIGALLGPIDAHAVERGHRISALDPDLFEETAGLHGVELHPDHLAVLILRQNVGLREERGGVSSGIFHLAARHREPIVREALDLRVGVRTPRSSSRDPFARASLEGQLLSPSAIFQHDPAPLDAHDLGLLPQHVVDAHDAVLVVLEILDRCPRKACVHRGRGSKESEGEFGGLEGLLLGEGSTHREG